MSKQKVLVTGADGFIGSHLVEELVHQGHSVKAFCYYNSFNSWGWLDTFPNDLLDKLEIFTGDIRDYHGVETAMQDCDVVYHLAALIAIPYSYYSPGSYIDTNVTGTMNVVQAARKLNVSRVLVTSTSEVYGTAQYVPINEDHPKQPQSPYSASKIGADCIAESFYRSFNTPITIVRPFNTFGPRQSARAIIPTIITQLVNGMEEIKLGDLTPTRDLLFVKDTAKAFIEIAKADTLIGEHCNIATNSEVSMQEIAETLIEKINPRAKITQDKDRIRPEKSEVYRLFGDNSKILKHTNWKVEHDLGSGLDKTIEWFSDSSNVRQYKADIYNV
ncbi:MAG: SDR family NAD(P)-dependent oxidoreductase [Crocinitomicaceae bacterium]|nr:SDR family NAD(P)-dependent oxidoreductase [Crocinitomicaceae bacterium]